MSNHEMHYRRGYSAVPSHDSIQGLQDVRLEVALHQIQETTEAQPESRTQALVAPQEVAVGVMATRASFHEAA